MKALFATFETFVFLTASAHAATSVTRPRVPLPDTNSLKYVILAIGLVGVLPLAAWIRRYPIIAPKIWMLMGLLPFIQDELHLNIALAIWSETENWGGFVHGFEFSALDLIALALYVGLPRARNPLPFRLSMVFYFAAVMLSSFQAPEPFAALFYPWQLARIYLVYAVASRSCADVRFVPALLTGMAIGLCFDTCVLIWQRYVLNVVDPSDHQNLRGLVSHFVVIPLFALLLAGRRGGLILGTLFAGTLFVALSASRAAIGLTGLGYVALFTLSVLRRPSQWKAVVGFTGVVALVVFALVAESSLERRFEATRTDGHYDERAAYVSAAAAILADHPMGIGANNFAFVTTTQGYSRGANVPKINLDISTGPHVHNAYWLTAAETGYIGLVAFVLLLLQPLITAFRCGWQNRKDSRGELLLGFSIALLMVYIHNFYEFIFFTLEVQYIIAMTFGMVAGLAQQLGYWRRSTVRGRRPDTLAILTRQSSLVKPQDDKIPFPPMPPAG